MFWDVGRVTLGRGECRRSAPHPLSIYESGHDDEETAEDDYFKRTVFWPITANDDWCGEFKPKPT